MYYSFLDIYIPACETRNKRKNESLPQDHTDQAADETQTQTAEEAEPITVHFAVNCKSQSFSSSQKCQQNISH